MSRTGPDLGTQAAKTRQRRAQDRVADQLRECLGNGLYPPNSYLPPERVLAEQLGTSRSTVSAALSTLADERLVVQTRGRGTRVLPPMDRLTRTCVGILSPLPELEAHEYPGGPKSAHVLAGIQETFHHLKFRYEAVMVRPPPDGDPRSPGDSPGPGLFIETLLERFGAVISVEAFWRQGLLEELERRRVPVTVANLEDDIRVSGTCIDHRKTTAQAVRLLVAMGHRRIAFLGRDPGISFYADAQESFRHEMAAAGVPVEGAWVATTQTKDALGAYFAAKPLLAVSPRPTAIVATRDRLGFGACRAITEMGLVVGRDVSVIGFDDATWPEEERFLTTFREPSYELGAVAAQMLAERIVSGWRPPERRELPAPFIPRRSVGPPPPAEGGPPCPAEDVQMQFTSDAREDA